MWCYEHIFPTEERMPIRKRLFLDNIKCCACEFLVVESVEQGFSTK